MSKAEKDTVNELAGREGLAVAETIDLAKARRALAPRKERVERHGWTAELTHHVHTHGRWYASAWRTGTGYSGERCLAGPVTEAEARAAVERFFAAC